MRRIVESEPRPRRLTYPAGIAARVAEAEIQIIVAVRGNDDRHIDFLSAAVLGHLKRLGSDCGVAVIRLQGATEVRFLPPGGVARRFLRHIEDAIRPDRE